MCIVALAPLGAAMTGTTVAAATTAATATAATTAAATAAATAATTQLATIGTITALQGASAAAQFALSIGSQKQQIKSQQRAQRRQAEAERDRFALEMTAKRINEMQEEKAVAQRKQEILKQGEQAISTATVAAGEAGVSGISVSAQLQDFERQEAQALFIASDIHNDRLTANWLDTTNSERASANTLTSINQPINQVDYLSPFINLGGQGLQIYSEAQEVALNQARLNNPT